MKRFLLVILIIPFIGFSQNPIQNNIPNHDSLPQNVMEKTNSMSLELEDDEMMDLNPINRVSDVKLQSFQSDMMVQSENEVSYRLYSETSVNFNQNDLTFKYEYTYGAKRSKIELFWGGSKFF